LPDFDHTFLFRKNNPKLRQDPPAAHLDAVPLLNGEAMSSSPWVRALGQGGTNKGEDSSEAAQLSGKIP
jgi:hypothetical protein